MTPSQIEGMEVEELARAVNDSKIAMIDRLLCHADLVKRVKEFPAIVWLTLGESDRKAIMKIYNWLWSDEVKAYVNKLKGTLPGSIQEKGIPA